MQTFRSFYAEKLGNDDFRQLFEQECHICRVTVALIAQLKQTPGGMEKIAAELSISFQALLDLEDAEHCDPQVVWQLCEYFDMTPPDQCPRNNGR